MVRKLIDFLNKICLNANIVLFIYPAFVLSLMVFFIMKNGFGLFEFLCIIFTYYTCNIAVGVGLHRYWSHNAFSITSRVVEFILCVLSASTLQTPILVWASDHAKHHAYTDTDKDPHSPLKFGGLKGFIWSHIGWMFLKNKENARTEFHRPTVIRLSKKNFVLWQMRYYGAIATIMNTIVPFTIGVIVGKSIYYGFSAYIFCGVGRFIQQHGTFCINSVTHFFGSKTHENSTAGDIGWMAIFLLGENYHNFHHAFPSDYRNGIKWYHFDAHKWIIFLLYKCGLAKDLVITAPIRVENGQKSLIQAKFSQIRSRWTSIKGKIAFDNALNNATIKTSGVDTLKTKVVNLYQCLNNLYQEISTSIESQDIKTPIKEKYISLLNKFERDMSSLEKYLFKIGIN
jgi:stearoyl-CoA desaturase (delta-9 desaturase)